MFEPGNMDLRFRGDDIQRIAQGLGLSFPPFAVPGTLHAKSECAVWTE